MEEIAFFVPNKFADKRREISWLINKVQATFVIIPNSEGFTYSMKFDCSEKVKVFRKELLNIIPDIIK